MQQITWDITMQLTYKPAHGNGEAVPNMPTPHLTPGATGKRSCRLRPTGGGTGEGRPPSRQMLKAANEHKPLTPPMVRWGRAQGPTSNDRLMPDKRQRHGEEAGRGECARDSLTAIFDRFWARLQAHLYPEVPHHPQPKRDRDDGSRVIGNPPQGKSKPYATGPSIHGPPGLRAAGDKPQRCQPHRRRTHRMGRLSSPPQKGRPWTTTVPRLVAYEHRPPHSSGAGEKTHLRDTTAEADSQGEPQKWKQTDDKRSSGRRRHGCTPGTSWAQGTPMQTAPAWLPNSTDGTYRGALVRQRW
ncbi:Hypothetical predicted protein [Pelobates cultripes]|uniref:Uncharacterized protein n=1 Tax=Pelobates cultripes TaxID=61616 RepID=A0AAD1R259_PELCU|nr:Hypothetical predicted protein [Pelobates cultripes]